MIDVATYTLFVNGKRFHGCLHTVEACTFPNIVNCEIVSAFGRHLLWSLELEPDLVRSGIRNLYHVSSTFPGLSQLALIAKSKLIADCKFYITDLELWQEEPGNMLAIQTEIPSDNYAFLSLSLLQLLVVVRLDLDKWPEDVLILIRVVIFE